MGCCASSAAGSPSTLPDEALDMLTSSAENMDVSLGQFGGIDVVAMMPSMTRFSLGLTIITSLHE